MWICDEKTQTRVSTIRVCFGMNTREKKYLVEPRPNSIVLFFPNSQHIQHIRLKTISDTPIHPQSYAIFNQYTRAFVLVSY